jgi:hypothetical protein
MALQNLNNLVAQTYDDDVKNDTSFVYHASGVIPVVSVKAKPFHNNKTMCVVVAIDCNGRCCDFGGIKERADIGAI